MALTGPSTQKEHMSTQQPESLRLADAIHHLDEAEAEISRLHALNAELLEALRAVDVLFGHLARDSTQRIWLDNARAALAKAEGREA